METERVCLKSFDQANAIASDWLAEGYWVNIGLETVFPDMEDMWIVERAEYEDH